MLNEESRDQTCDDQQPLSFAIALISLLFSWCRTTLRGWLVSFDLHPLDLGDALSDQLDVGSDPVAEG